MTRPLEDLYREVGRITICWNYAEMALKELFVEYLHLRGRVGWLIVENIRNQDRCDILTAAVDEFNEAEPLRGHILHGISHFNISRENRNHITHSFYDISEESLFLNRFKRGLGKHIRHLGPPWEALGDTIAAIDATTDFLEGLVRSLRRTDSELAIPLPEKPPLPRKLTLHPLFPQDD